MGQPPDWERCSKAHGQAGGTRQHSSLGWVLSTAPTSTPIPVVPHPPGQRTESSTAPVMGSWKAEGSAAHRGAAQPAPSSEGPSPSVIRCSPTLCYQPTRVCAPWLWGELWKGTGGGWDPHAWEGSALWSSKGGLLHGTHWSSSHRDVSLPLILLLSMPGARGHQAIGHPIALCHSVCTVVILQGQSSGSRSMGSVAQTPCPSLTGVWAPHLVRETHTAAELLPVLAGQTAEQTRQHWVDGAGVHGCCWRGAWAGRAEGEQGGWGSDCQPQQLLHSPVSRLTRSPTTMTVVELWALYHM